MRLVRALFALRLGVLCCFARMSLFCRKKHTYFFSHNFKQHLSASFKINPVRGFQCLLLIHWVCPNIGEPQNGVASFWFPVKAIQKGRQGEQMGASSLPSPANRRKGVQLVPWKAWDALEPSGSKSNGYRSFQVRVFSRELVGKPRHFLGCRNFRNNPNFVVCSRYILTGNVEDHPIGCLLSTLISGIPMRSHP